MTRKVTTMPRPVDADGSYTLKASDYTGYSLVFSGGNIAVIDEFGHIEAEFDAGDIPTIEAEPVKHGRWKPVKLTRRTTEYKCSVCGRWERTNKEPYCNCGAKMDGRTNCDTKMGCT